MTIDNCCTCQNGSGGQVSATVAAEFLWPGWPGFGTLGLGDAQGVLYTAVVWKVTLSDNGNFIGQFTWNLSVDGLNGTPMGDSLTGTALGKLGAPLVQYALGSGTTTHSEGTDSFGNAITTDLSSPIILATVKANCQALLGLLDVHAVAPGFGRLIHYNYGSSYSAQNLGLPIPNIIQDNNGNWFWVWISQNGGPLTAHYDNNFNPIFTPFQHVSPTPIVISDNTNGPFQGLGYSSYDQEVQWTMAKSLWKPANSPVCCTDQSTIAPDFCHMVSPDGSGNLILNPPSLAANTSINSATIQTSPSFGKSLTGGGCPCA